MASPDHSDTTFHLKKGHSMQCDPGNVKKIKCNNCFMNTMHHNINID